MLHDLSRQLTWPVWFEGRCEPVKMDAEDWKHVLTAGLEKSQRMAQGIEGGYVLLGQRTSKMSIKKMALLIELIKHFGDSHGIKWTPDPKTRALMEADHANY